MIHGGNRIGAAAFDITAVRDVGSVRQKVDRKRKSHGESELGNTIGRITDYVANGDLMGSAIGNVNVIISCGGKANEPKLTRRGEGVFVTANLIDHDDVGIGNALVHFMREGAFVAYDLAEGKKRYHRKVRSQGANI
jgi:hypothetical protein